MLKIILFGPSQINSHTRCLTNKMTGRVLALLSYLLLNKGPQNRSHLADLLWSEISEKQAKSNLRYVLYDLRKTLGEHLIVTRQTVAFDENTPNWVDANVFSLFMATEFPAAEPEIINGVLQLYKGELLAGLYIQDAPNFDRWLEDERRHLQDQATQAWLRLCENALETGDYKFGITTGRELLKLDPGCENAHRLVMKQLAYAGQRTAALAQFALCQEELEREYDVPPDEATYTLFYQIQRGELTPPSVLESRPASTTGTQIFRTKDTRVNAEPLLPSAAEEKQLKINWELIPRSPHFVGRETELEQLRGWIERDRYQVIGLFGLPGMGKSALAAELVTRLAEANGIQEQLPFEYILWHSASRFSSLLELLQVWSNALDSSNKSSASIEGCLQHLMAHLRNRRVMLVLDDVQSILARPDGLPPRGSTASTGLIESQDEANHSGYRSGWAGMGELLRRLAEVDHGGCLLMMSDVIPVDWQQLSWANSAMRQFSIAEIQPDDVTALLTCHGLPKSAADDVRKNDSLIANPKLLLSQMGFFREYGNTFGLTVLPLTWFRENVSVLLTSNFQRLNSNEREILLSAVELLSADVERSKTVQELWQFLDGRVAISAYLDVIRSLQRHLLIKIHGAEKTITMPKMVRLFAEQLLIRSISHELQLLIINHRQRYLHDVNDVSVTISEQQNHDAKLDTLMLGSRNIVKHDLTHL